MVCTKNERGNLHSKVGLNDLPGVTLGQCWVGNWSAGFFATDVHARCSPHSILTIILKDFDFKLIMAFQK